MNSNTNETHPDILASDEQTTNTHSGLLINNTDTSDVSKITTSLIDGVNSQVVSISSDIHNKMYGFLINELNNLKSLVSEKDNLIQTLQNTIDELSSKLSDTETRLTKMNNIELLLKLKENLTNKQNEISSELKNELNNNISETKETELNLLVKNKKLNVHFEDEKSNIIEDEKSSIIEDQSPSLKPKKKPAVFRRRF
jgi:hypothetical protein